MSNLTIGFICLGISILFIVIRMPIGLALGAPALVGLSSIIGFNRALSAIKNIPFEFAANFEISALPMFILMGTIALHTKLTTSLFDAARVWLGRLPGGLAIATNYACAGFAAASGSSLATTIAMGRLAVPEMRRHNYDPGLATGVIAAAGTLGSLIPPSILMVIYAIFAEVSIPKLFLAGFLPGLLTAFVYMVMILARCRLNPQLAPVAARPPTAQERWQSIVEVWPLPTLIVGVIGSIYTGFATATEAAALGVVLSLVIAAAKRSISWPVLVTSLRDSIHSSVTIFFIAVGAVMMTKLMALAGVPQFLTTTMQQYSVDPLSLVLATSVLYLILGCLLDPIGMVFLTLPVILPLFKAQNLDLIWFGILLIKYVEIGLITPPVGMNVFAVKAMNPDIPMGVIFKGVSWFIACETLVLALLIAFPRISLFLPSTM
ncbi:MAG: TRAP transporter large permease subunit [Alphaproteobacteria bacterium]|nr:TRAP transporter large permease subunit [Alphaproteobacteria bacterium]